MKKLTFTLLSIISIFSINAQDSGDDASKGNYGYTWASSLTAEVTGRWVDITTNPNAIELTERFTDDSNFGPISFNFNFPYYWYTRNSFSIGANGYINFNEDLIAAGFPEVPSAGGVSDDFITPFMGDLTFVSVSGDRDSGAECWFYTNFKDSVVVSWIDVPFFNAASPEAGGSHTFQVILELDGTISFNYQTMIGDEDVNSLCAGGASSDCNNVGFENVSGAIGLLIKEDQEAKDYFGVTGMNSSPTNPGSFEIKRPENSTYTVEDLRATYVGAPRSRGRFIPINTEGETIWGGIENIGLVESSLRSLTGRLFEGVQPVGENSSVLVSSIPVGETQEINTNKEIPTDEAKIFKSEVGLNSIDEDPISGNNKASQLIAIVDTSLELIDLRYHDNSANGDLTFVGGQPTYNVGVGLYMDIPLYPALVVALNFNVTGTAGTPTEGMRFEMYDDDGVDIFGVPDGSPGTLLYFEDYLPGSLPDGLLKITLPDGGIQINSGGVYLIGLQGGTTVGSETDNTAPHSYNSFEVTRNTTTGEVFLSIFRDNKTRDIMYGMDIKKGDPNKIIDLAITDIVSPTTASGIFDSVDVTIEISNVGPVDIDTATQFVVNYQLDKRSPIFENVKLDIPSGGTVNYTFKNKAVRPAPPKDKYDKICAGVTITNDLVKSNDDFCTANFSSVKPKLAYIHSEVFPNPANDLFYVTYFATEVTSPILKLVNINGQVVRNIELGEVMPGKQSFSVNSSDLAPGIYTYQILSHQTRTTGKVTIVK
ncbi:MAG: hypothetical protein ACJAZ3_001531 [Sphingobacteriales bacterium]|jgi:hypothetical protein